MKKPLSVLMVSALVLSGCASMRESRVNPFNWFGGGSGATAPAAAGDTNPLIPERRASIFRSKQPAAYAGTPVGEVTEVLLERRPGGLIVRVTGVADSLGPFEVRLVKNEAESDADTLAYDLLALQQPGPRSTGERARMVTVGQWLTEQDLYGIREISVTGLRNTRIARR